MHELSLVCDAVDAILDRVGTARVIAVRLEVGRLAAVVPDALRFCFDVCTRGTPLAGAVLEIAEQEGRGACRACGGVVTMRDLLARCSCGSVDVEITSGDTVRLLEVELA